MRGKRTARSLMVALLVVTTVGMLAGSALAAAHAEKQILVDELNTLAETESGHANWMIRTAAQMVERGLADALWVDDATPAKRATFRADAQAVTFLNMAGRRAPGASAALTEIQAELTAIDRTLAADRLAQAIDTQGNVRKIDRAARLIDLGDTFAEDGRHSRAIRLYMRAWQVATRGLGDLVPADGASG